MKKYFITIPANTEESKGRQFFYYQNDGKTVQVPVGMSVEVPEWLAKRAKDIGDIDDYNEVEIPEA